MPAPARPAERPGGRRLAAHAGCLGLLVAATTLLYGALLHHHVLATQEGFRIPLRTYEYVREIGRGHWIPQVFPDAANGVGYAFPRFYAPVAYLVSAGLAVVTGDVVWGTNLAFFLSVICSGLAMYFLVVVVTRRGDPLVGLASAVLYVALPYRFLDIFVRGDLAESWTFVWYPLILAGTWETLRRRRLSWYLPVALCGLLLTHTTSFLYFGLVYGAVVIAAFWLEHRLAVLQLTGALVVAAGFALWFVVPQAHGLSSVPAGHPEQMWSTVAQVDASRVPPSELLGIGARPPANPAVPPNRRMHLGLGLGQLLTPLTLGLLLLIPAGRNHLARRDERRLRWLLLLLTGAWVWTLLFMIGPASFLRLMPAAFSYIQFPWRLLGLAVFLSSAVIGLALAAWRMPRWATGIVVAAGVLAVVLVPGDWRSPSVAGVSADAFSNPALARATPLTKYTELAEYRPIELSADRLPNLPSTPQVVGDGDVSGWTTGRHTMTATVTMRSPGTVVLPVLFYDFYVVKAGSHRVPTVSSDGLLAVRLPAGQFGLSVEQGLTGWSRLGLTGTAATVVVYGLWLARRRRGSPARRGNGESGRCSSVRAEAAPAVASELDPVDVLGGDKGVDREPVVMAFALSERSGDSGDGSKSFASPHQPGNEDGPAVAPEEVEDRTPGHDAGASLVHETMMATAEQHEVLQRRRAAPGPVPDMMAVDEASVRAAGVPAAAVPPAEGPADGGGDDGSLPPDVEHVPGTHSDPYGRGVAGETARGLRSEGGAVVDVAGSVVRLP